MNQKGRSMVEMLGVLAIIGVLSVGALAGYSKAMKRHKLNIQAEQISTLIMAEMTYQEQIGVPQNTQMLSGSHVLVPIYKSLNAIPENMIIPGNNTYIQDIFRNRVLLYTYDNKSWHAIRVELKTDQNIESCINIFETAKNYSPNIWQKKKKKNTVTNLYNAYGDRYCTEDERCLKELKIADYPDACNLCKDINSCQIYIWVE